MPIPIHFSSLILRMLKFTLSVSCFTMSNLPWFMDPTSQSLGNIFLTTSHFTFTTRHVHNWESFLFCPASSFFPSYFSILPHWHIGHLLTWRAHLLVSYLFAFHTVQWKYHQAIGNIRRRPKLNGKYLEVIFHVLSTIWMVFRI